MSAFPNCKHDMRRAGYKFLGSSTCKSCTSPIEWWSTTNGRKIPINPTPENDHAEVTVHWATCSNADSHRAPRRGAPTDSLDAHQSYLEAFRRSSNARVVIAIFDNGSIAAWRKGISGEDLRQDLITEANKVRNHIEKEGHA